VQSREWAKPVVKLLSNSSAARNDPAGGDLVDEYAPGGTPQGYYNYS
jgi:hypothetical protein